MAKITQVKARQILDSRGEPTVEVDMWLDGEELFGRAAIPSGASTGTHEALELRDGDKSRYLGKGVSKAIENIEKKIAPAIIGRENLEQGALDKLMIELDGSTDKSNLGANAILGVSLAFAKAQAVARKLPLYLYIAELYDRSKLSMPSPMFNIMNGGKHANWSTDIQEFMVMVEAETYQERLRGGMEIFGHLGKLLKEKGLSLNVGNEGGYAPGFDSNESVFELLSEAVSNAGYKLGGNVFFALDVAASEFYNSENGKYTLKTENRELSKQEWMDTLSQWVSKYPLKSIEDPFSEDDWESWAKFTQEHGSKLQIVGDDILVTNISRIERAITEKSCNALLVKLNQIGTLTETLQAMTLSEKNGWNNVVSHRSGETEDVTISHLAVGTSCGQIKTGAPSRGERTAKYNELLRISEGLI
jgi:enolase